eukprot:m.18206 g.18206  ORF g.18206 m.18206 type:complete len:55 (+) comp9556_c0_seq2:225-389(+)
MNAIHRTENTHTHLHYTHIHTHGSHAMQGASIENEDACGTPGIYTIQHPTSWRE